MTTRIDRRALLAVGGLVAASVAFPVAAQEETADQHMKRMRARSPNAPKVAMLVFPNMVALDLLEPMTVFAIMGFDIRLVWKDRTPALTDVGIPIAPTHTFEECPANVDILFVPGGTIGSVACMKDPAVLGFLADRGSRAKWVTSVCTGSLVLAAAGLLKGYEATGHWAVADLLPLMGAKHVNKRVVRDRNRMTGGGVTAGLDFALTLAAIIGGEEAARRVQLNLEYSPEPPFANGTPEEAGANRTALLRKSRAGMDREAKLAAEAAAIRLGL